MAGNILLGLGISLMSRAQLGSDAVVAFSEVCSGKIGITMGQMTTLINICLFITILIVWRKNIGIATAIVAFLNQYPIDFFNAMLSHSDSFFINVLMCLLGILITAAGAAVIIETKLGMGIYEAFMYSFVYRFHFRFVYVKYVVDGFFLIITLILRGPIGLGTLLSYFLTGIFIEFFTPYAGKIMRLE